MKNISDKDCRENRNADIMFNNFFFENRAVYEIMWKNILERGRPQMTIWRMSIACWIPKATNTQSGYVMLFHSNNGCTKASQCYFVRSLPVLFSDLLCLFLYLLVVLFVVAAFVRFWFPYHYGSVKVRTPVDVSLFRRAFYITIVSLTPTHALVLSYTKIT